MKELSAFLAGILDPFFMAFSIPNSWDASTYSVLFNIRLPRIIAAVLVGAALSTAGAAYQGMFQNPLVSPDILGASAGAGFGAALAIYFYLDSGYITLFAFLGGLISVGIAYLISRLTRDSTTLSMVLAGILVGSLFSSATSYIKLVTDTNDQLPAITYWLMGSLSGATMDDVIFAGIVITAGIIPIYLLRWRMNVLTLDEDEARSIGLNTNLLRIIMIICATLITSVAVSISGIIGWVGLVIPHFCRMLFGFDYRRIIPASIVMGSGFLLLVDDLSRTIATIEVSLGILTAFVGAPIFAYLLMIGGRIL
ncbi:MAG TPA: iron ABC transporter permease [Methanocorpusculum sp.]|nr:iron ABC transporter permease [Methanocorpusculum sp.]